MPEVSQQEYDRRFDEVKAIFDRDDLTKEEVMAALDAYPHQGSVREVTDAYMDMLNPTDPDETLDETPDENPDENDNKPIAPSDSV